MPYCVGRTKFLKLGSQFKLKFVSHTGQPVKHAESSYKRKTNNQVIRDRERRQAYQTKRGQVGQDTQAQCISPSGGGEVPLMILHTQAA